MQFAKELYPDKKVVKLPINHPVIRSILKAYYKLRTIPKIHKHDGDPPEAYGIFVNGRLVLLYFYSSDVADGWEPPGVFNDPPRLRELAIRFGVNLVYYVLTH